ncbi:O-antigen ligase family protein [Fonticella tunisiensis]|uniref:O-antigen ligase n=1 Tax=Fonticella tunisiensis TaxID=1096341 RepID=A0A4R7K9Q4_9CLOT|nr:O-antigen ligase family protein [Fonticella tunisiensis]TDT50821.1 O-antigen ligase [Fonticella tunisiensis]
MNFKRVFNFFIYLFMIIVTLLPFKARISFIPLSADFVIGGLAIVSGIAYLVFNKGCRFTISQLMENKEIRIIGIGILGFTLLSFISLGYAESKAAVISEAIRFLEYVIMFFMLLLIADLRLIKNSFYAFYAAMIAAAIIGVLQFIFNGSSYFDTSMPFGRGRIYSTFVNPNYWGAAINLVIFYPMLHMLEYRGKDRAIDALVFLIFMFNLVFSFTRGSWLGFMTGIFVIGVIRYRKTLYAIPVMIVGALLVPSIRNRFLSIFTMKSVTSLQRVKLWTTGWIMFKEHFWLGVGNGNYGQNYPKYIERFPELFVSKELFSVHNSYLKVLAELGIFGGIFFIIIYVGLALLCYKVFKNTGNTGLRLIALSLVGFWGAYLFQNFLNNLMFIPQLNVFVWILTALLYKGYLLEKQEDKI